MITTLSGTEFAKQVENSAKRCSTNAQKLGNSSIHEPDAKHGILRKKPPFCEGCESKKSKFPGKARVTHTREETAYAHPFHQDMGRLT